MLVWRGHQEVELDELWRRGEEAYKKTTASLGFENVLTKQEFRIWIQKLFWVIKIKSEKNTKWTLNYFQHEDF